MRSSYNNRGASYYNDRGIDYYNKGKYDQAIADFSKTLEINPNHAAYVLSSVALSYYNKRGV